MEAILYIEDGSIFTGKAFGKVGTSVGELVFNTSMMGYQEILTDPSYANQIINMTYPLIGNYGINSEENESSRIYAKGFIVKAISSTPSNYKSEESIEEVLNKMGIVGIYGVDTRSITKKIRSCGAMKCVITSEPYTVSELELLIRSTDQNESPVKEVSTKEKYHIAGNGHKVAVLDFGAKNNIIENLKLRNCDITVFPYNAGFSEIMSSQPDGLFLSNGPGDPKQLPDTVKTIKKLTEVLPTFGICLGHQLLALAFGGDTYKMKYGHRGGNHGIYDIDRDRAYITSQNHGYAVDGASLENKSIDVTHINLNDKTIEGMKHKVLPVFSVQFHPEGAPGPTDTSYLFDKFITLMDQPNVAAV